MQCSKMWQRASYTGQAEISAVSPSGNTVFQNADRHVKWEHKAPGLPGSWQSACQGSLKKSTKYRALHFKSSNVLEKSQYEINSKST